MTKLQRFDYTGKDFNTIVADTIQHLKEEYPDRWTDFEQDNAGRMMIEAFAYICDMLLFYLDRQANECYLPTARERQKVINICKLIGYQLAPAAPAQAEVKFALQGAHESAVTIPIGTAITTVNGKRFELDHEVVIPAGDLSAMGNCTEGQTYRQVVGNSNGEPGQVYGLPHKGVIAVLAVVIDGKMWSRVDSLALTLSYDCAYTADIDAFGRAQIAFGDGKKGSIPNTNAAVIVQYRVGGGVAGIVAANTLIRMPMVARDVKGQSVIVTTTNPQAAVGGMDEEDIAHAKAWAPVSFEAQGRLVTEKDYEAAANSYSKENIGRFAKAAAVVHERSGEANVIRIYALAQSTEGRLVAPPQSLIDAFIADIDDIKMLTDHVDVVPAQTKAVNIAADICILPGFLEDEVFDTIHTDLAKFLRPENRAMGSSLRYSDLYRVIDASAGVDWVEIRKPVSTVTSTSNELIVLGQIDLKAVDDHA